VSSPDHEGLEAQFPEVARLLRDRLPDAPRERPSEDVWQNIIGQVRAESAEPHVPMVDLRGAEQQSSAAMPAEHPGASQPVPHTVVPTPTPADRPPALPGHNGAHATEAQRRPDAVRRDIGHQDHFDAAHLRPNGTRVEHDFDRQAPIDPSQGSPGGQDSYGPGVIDLNAVRAKRKSSRWVGLVAAAAAVVVAVPMALFVMGRTSAPDASTDLVALPAQSGEGAAELRGRTLTVDINTNAAPDGSFYEVWLLEIDEANELRDLRSLGPIQSGVAFELPEGLDLDRFDVVDVSLEADDGNPDHSGDSVLRGVLT
jgi:hypothetical protein